MSQRFNEILQLVVFFLVVGSLLTFYVIYPLDRTKAILGRADLDSFNPDSLPANDPSRFIDAGLVADTFSLETSGLTTVACLYLTSAADSLAKPRGTVILIHDERLDRGSMLPIATELVNLGFAVAVYDQRACGRSGAKYHGEGQFEAADLTEIITYLDIRERLTRPALAVGFSLGADAALLASRSGQRIDAVIAIEPYLSTERMLSVLKERHQSISIPFFRTVMWWWYEMRSGYESQYRTMEDIQPATTPTLILAGEASRQSEEYLRLAELSTDIWFQSRPLPEDSSAVLSEIVKLLESPILHSQPVSDQ